jgi:hypothetical protein
VLSNTLVSDPDFQYINYTKSAADTFFYIIAHSTNNTSIDSAEGSSTSNQSKT